MPGADVCPLPFSDGFCGLPDALLFSDVFPPGLPPFDGGAGVLLLLWASWLLSALLLF